MSKKVLLINAFIIIFFSSLSFAFEKGAQDLVQNTTDSAKKIILDKSITIESKKEKIEKIALDVVDVDGLGRFTLGSERKNLSEDQLNKYKKIFRVFFFKKS